MSAGELLTCATIIHQTALGHGAGVGICTSVVLSGACEGECYARLHRQAQIHVFLWIELLEIHSGEVQGSPGEALHGCFGTYGGW